MWPRCNWHLPGQMKQLLLNTAEDISWSGLGAWATRGGWEIWTCFRTRRDDQLPSVTMFLICCSYFSADRMEYHNSKHPQEEKDLSGLLWEKHDTTAGTESWLCFHLHPGSWERKNRSKASPPPPGTIRTTSQKLCNLPRHHTGDQQFK